MAHPTPRRLTYTEYLATEAASEVKHEWLDGVAVAMAGGTPTHALLQSRVVAALAGAFGSTCDVYTSDLRVRVPASGLATYPDVSVICGPVEPHPEDPDAATNPAVLVEVLCPTTERWDRGDKFAHYQKLESLQVYVLVHQDRQWVEWYARQEDGTWHYHAAGPGDAVLLGQTGASFTVDAVYARTGVPIRDAPPLWLGEPEWDEGLPQA